MKSTKFYLVLLSVMTAFSFASCNDNDRRGENDQMRNDSIRMAEENRLEQERMDFENNSVFAMVQEDTVLSTFSGNLESNQLSRTFMEEEGPYTIFAPSNQAYQSLSQEERTAWGDARNLQENSARLHYLIVDEELTEENLRQEIEAAGGTYVLTSMQGEEINATLEGDKIVLTDGAGNKATIIESNREASNGVIHVIDGILKPSDLSVNQAGTMGNNNLNTNRNQNTNQSTNRNQSTPTGGDTTAINRGM